jgi:hypothetical protein
MPVEDQAKAAQSIYNAYKSAMGAFGASLPSWSETSKIANDVNAVNKLIGCAQDAGSALEAGGGNIGGGLPAFALADERMRTLDYVYATLNRLGNRGQDLQTYKDLTATTQMVLYGAEGPENRYVEPSPSVFQDLKDMVGRHERSLFTSCVAGLF